MPDEPSPDQRPASDQLRQQLLRISIPTSTVLEAALLVGRSLQGIPEDHRQLTIARLRTAADQFHSHELHEFAQLFEVVIEGWEDIGN